MSNLADRLAGLSPAQRALLEKRLAAKEKSTPNPAAAPIAIIGMACRLPGAPTLDDYWRVIRGGVDTTSETPPDRWDVDALHDPTGEQRGKLNTRRGGFLENIDQFDPQFFGITPREANRMDPQQRLLLEVAWEAMENAGCPPDHMAGTKTGVYVGIGGSDYSKTPVHNASDFLSVIDGYMGTGNALSIAANRVSYILDLQGPSLAVDTACSSSSVAVHLAAESLRRGECTAALAGGVNAILTPETSIAFSNAKMLSPDGHCRPFDSRANGYVRGEGCGLVLLKRLDQAERDGDQVLAVLRATSVNQDGRTSGISAPNGESQKRCLRAAHAQAGVTPDDFGYIEAHGTGTPLGDPIEMQALAEVFADSTGDAPPLHVTSVKANIGHTETVSGIAGLIKVVLMLGHGEKPPQTHLESLNPHIKLAGSRLNIPTEVTPWTERRLAGVSSFGFGGTNTHLLLSAADESTDAAAGQPTKAAAAGRVNNDAPVVLKLTGKTLEAIAEQAHRLVEQIEPTDHAAAEIGFSANTGRCDLQHRAVVVASDREKLFAGLKSLAEGAPGPTARTGQRQGFQRRKVAMLFSGQGAQYAGMGQELMRFAPHRKAIERCAAAFEGHLDKPLADLLADTEASTNGKPHASLIDQTRYTQPALFAVEYALSQLWASIGVTPDFVAGHSIGEYVAAVLAGVMEVEDAAKLVAIRGRLMQSAPAGGKMAAVFADEAIVAKAIAGHEAELSIAAVNSPGNTVVSGEAAAVDAVLQQLAAAGHDAKELRVSHAFHSPMMDRILNEFEQAAAEIEYRPPTIPLASNLTGELTTKAPTARYWRDHLRGAVRFADNLRALVDAGAVVGIEAGPGTTLLGLGKKTVEGAAVSWLPSIRRGQSDATVFAGSVGQHYVDGGDIEWRKWHAEIGGGSRRIPLPNYPFNRSRCWLEFDGKPGRRRATTSSSDHPLLGAAVQIAWANRLFESTLRADAPDYLADHVVQGSVVTPGAAYLEQSLAAAGELFGEGVHTIRDLRIGQAMFLTEADRPVQVTVAPESGGESQLEVFSTAEATDDGDDTWALHASARLQHGSAETPETVESPVDVTAWRSQDVHRHEENEFYESAAKVGFAYGPQFQVLPEVDTHPTTDDGVEALAEVHLTDAVLQQLSRYRLHPVLGDACLQGLACAITGDAKGRGHMPVAIDRVRVHRQIEADEPLQVFARREPYGDEHGEAIRGNAWLLAEDGTPIAEFEGIRLQAIAGGGGESADPTSWLYRPQWSEAPIEAADESAFDASGSWLLFANEGGSVKQVADQLEAGGGSVVVVRPGDAYKVVVDESRRWTNVTIDPTDAEHYKKLLSMATANPAVALQAVVSAWAMDGDDAESIAASAMRLLQQLLRTTTPPARGVWLVTAGAQAGEGLPTTDVAVDQAALVGLGRVARVEMTDLKPRLVDLDPAAGSAEQANALLTELSAADGEDQIAWREAKRYRVRLTPAPQAFADEGAVQGRLTVPARGAYQLRIAKPGTLEALRYEPITPLAPAAGEVVFEVHAAALNFSDVLKALGLYPGVRDAVVPLGIEASGVVTAVGEGVEHFKVGDEVMGVAPYAFASHAKTPDYTLAKKPKALSHEQAAAAPIAFMTAYHGLVELAQVAEGERVLIHAGAGGVGLAAIQIAQHAGAEVFATAGSDEKRDYLRSLGVKHVFSSRSLDFADGVLAATDREGVDVVLNSLPGEAITKSFAVLRAYGRFLEIGKTDIYQDRKIGLLPFQDNLSYHAIDLDRVLRQRPAYVRELLGEVLERFAAGDYTPTRQTDFPVDETVAAFRYMQQRKNIGKIVVAKGEGGQREPEDGEAIRTDGAYLITGGRGALGLRLAGWLADQGAGAVVLLSRGVPTGEAADKIDLLRDRGLVVAIAQGDVTDAASLEKALADLPKDLPPLRGVIHAAGVLADGMLAEMSIDQLAKPMRPKTVGAWNLHNATKDFPLDFFVLFSSVASQLGSPGQANYAAGNAVLDALAHHRQQVGQPATVINWGPWADGGMATADGQADSIESRGMALLPPEPSLDLLGKLIRSGATQAMVADARWAAMARSMGSRRPSALADLLGAAAEDAGATVSQADLALRKQLAESSAEERSAMLLDLVRGELARVMAVEPDGLDPDQLLADYGLDSLMSLELKNSVEGRLGVTLPMAKLLDGPSIRSLAEALAEQLSASGDGQAAGEDAWRPLSQLKPGAGPPLFLLPTLGGDIQCYREFVNDWEGDQPIVAFRPRGLNDPAPPHDGMDEMVADYVAAIRLEQPDGPYHLAAWSTGGIPAVAVAERLEAEGADVAAVILFDTPHPAAYRSVEVDNDLQFLCDTTRFAAKFSGLDVEMKPEQFDGMPEGEQFGAALDEAKRAGMFPEDIDEAFVRRLVNIGKGLIRACAEYQPGPLRAPVTLFRPETEGHLAEVTGVDESDDHGWGDDLGATPENRTAPGDHFTIMTGAGAKQLAAEVASLIGTS